MKILICVRHDEQVKAELNAALWQVSEETKALKSQLTQHDEKCEFLNGRLKESNDALRSEKDKFGMTREDLLVINSECLLALLFLFLKFLFNCFFQATNVRRIKAAGQLQFQVREAE